MKNFLSIEDDFVDTRLDKWFKKKVSKYDLEGRLYEEIDWFSKNEIYGTRN